jgi:phage gpG-like protein
MNKVTIEVLGDRQVARAFRDMGSAVTDWSAAWDDVGDLLRASAKKQFDSHGQYGSGGWEPLAFSTLASKNAKGQPRDILRATGRLEDSLTVKDDTEHMALGGTTFFHWGTFVPYASYHMTGTGARRTADSAFGPMRQGMPRRKPVELPEADRREIVRILQRYAVDAAKGIGPTTTRPGSGPPAGGGGSGTSVWARAKARLGW